jgi:nucleoside-diphosphate-sugar epimerase
MLAGVGQVSLRSAAPRGRLLQRILIAGAAGDVGSRLTALLRGTSPMSVTGTRRPSIRLDLQPGWSAVLRDARSLPARERGREVIFKSVATELF